MTTQNFTPVAYFAYKISQPASYAVVHDAATGIVGEVGTALHALQEAYYPGGDDTKTPVGFLIYRGFLFFDCTDLPDNAIITVATLNVPVGYYLNKNDFYIVVQSGAPTYPHNPVVSGDYDCSHYSGNYGQLLIPAAGFSGGTIELNDLSLIQREDITKLVIRTSGDIGNSFPYQSDQEIASYATLTITYTTDTVIRIYPAQYDLQSFHLWPVRAYGDNDYRPISRAHSGQLIVAKDLNLALNVDVEYLGREFAKGQTDTLTEYVNFESADAFTVDLTNQTGAALATFGGVNLHTHLESNEWVDPGTDYLVDSLKIQSNGALFTYLDDMVFTFCVDISKCEFTGGAAYSYIGFFDPADVADGLSIRFNPGTHIIWGYANASLIGTGIMPDGEAITSIKILYWPGQWAKLAVNNVLCGTLEGNLSITPHPLVIWPHIGTVTDAKSLDLDILRIGYTQEFVERL